MANQRNRNHAAVPTDAGVPATQASPQRDANGFDPADFEWRPVPRRARADGWTPEVQQRFIEALARFGVVERACQEVNMSVTSAYNLRNSAAGDGFARAWRAVLGRAADRVLDIAFEHAVEGEEIPIFDCDGRRVGSKRRYNTRMAMFLLRAYHPERFRHAHKDVRDADECLAPPPVPLAEIVATLAPVPPAEPHLLATPERLDDMLETARVVADVGERLPLSERQPYRHRRIPDDDPGVVERAARNRHFRHRREEDRDAEWQDYRERTGLNFASTSEPPAPRDPLSDFTYWAEEEARKKAAAECEDDEADSAGDEDGDGDGDGDLEGDESELGEEESVGDE